MPHISLRWRQGSAFIQSARRKCVILYDSFVDRDLGLIHVRLQTWCPLQPQSDGRAERSRGPGAP